MLRDARRELALGLYRLEAGVRVVGRLQGEVEGNRREIARLVAELKGRDME